MLIHSEQMKTSTQVMVRLYVSVVMSWSIKPSFHESLILDHSWTFSSVSLIGSLPWRGRETVSFNLRLCRIICGIHANVNTMRHWH